MSIISKSIERIKRNILSILMLAVPAGRSAVVFTVPVMEGNAVEVVRWLNRNYRGKVTWLIADQFDSKEASKLISEDDELFRVEIVPKQSIRGFIAWLRADLVLFTYVLYRGPKPRGNRIFVNLWHGDGPKVDVPNESLSCPAQITVAGTELWGRAKVRSFRSPIDGMKVTGNPRIDQFQRPATDDDLELLGLDPKRPIVVWAPTYRNVRSDANTKPWSDSSEADPFRELRAKQDGFVETLKRLNIQIVVKRHPMDAEAFEFLDGMVHLDNDKLLANSLGFYQVLARSAAMITDYSSIWTDYLPLNLPVGLYCPDIEAYSKGRGFDIPGLEHFAPGPILTNVESLLHFLDEVSSGEDPGRSERLTVIDKIGAVTELGATERLMRALVPPEENL